MNLACPQRFRRSCSCGRLNPEMTFDQAAAISTTLRSDAFDLGRRPIEYLLDLPDLLRSPRRALRCVDRLADVLESAVHFHHRLSENVLREVGDPREDVVDQRLVLGQMRSPVVGDLVDLLAGLLRPRSRVAQILEHRQRRIHRPRTRRIHPAETLLDLLDDLVAVTRLLVEKTKNHELEMPLVEHSSAAKRPTSRLSPTAPKSARVETKILRPHPERPGKPLPAISVTHIGNYP